MSKLTAANAQGSYCQPRCVAQRHARYAIATRLTADSRKKMNRSHATSTCSAIADDAASLVGELNDAGDSGATEVRFVNVAVRPCAFTERPPASSASV